MDLGRNLRGQHDATHRWLLGRIGAVPMTRREEDIWAIIGAFAIVDALLLALLIMVL